MYDTTFWFIIFIVLFSCIFLILIISQVFPCVMNHSFADPEAVFCDECGSVLTSVCPNGHRVDGDFCSVCGLKAKE